MFGEPSAKHQEAIAETVMSPLGLVYFLYPEIVDYPFVPAWKAGLISTGIMSSIDRIGHEPAFFVYRRSEVYRRYYTRGTIWDPTGLLGDYVTAATVGPLPPPKRRGGSIGALRVVGGERRERGETYQDGQKYNVHGAEHKVQEQGRVKGGRMARVVSSERLQICADPGKIGAPSDERRT